ncbi:MAG: tetratricopeptide repeat protein, partial [Casimicrobiaceae bacterium]
AYRDQGQIQLALRDFEQSTRLGDGGEGLFATAEWLVASGRRGQALQALAGALSRGMDGAPVLINAGALLEAQGEPELALRAYTRAIEAPGAAREFVAEARAKRALLSFALGRVSADIFTDVEQALAVAPGGFSSRLADAYARLARKDVPAARERFERLHGERPTLATASGLLQTLKAAGDLDAARRLLAEHGGLTDDKDRRALNELALRLGLTEGPRS